MLISIVVTADSVSTMHVLCLCAENSSNIAQRLCSHSVVSNWIMVRFQPCG